MKLVLKLVVALVILVAVTLLVVVMRVDSIAKTGIERGGQYALGVPTTVDDVKIRILGGTVGLTGLQINNAPGFDPGSYLMRNDRFHFGINTGSIFSDTIEVDLIELDGLDVHIIKRGDKDNIKPILDHLKQFEGGEKAEDEAGSSKQFVVKKIVIRNITAHVDLPVVGTRTVALKDEIVIENLTQDNAEGLVMSEIMARLFPMITAVVVQSLGDILPTDLIADLNSGLSDVASNLGGNIEGLIKNPARVMEELGGTTGEALKGITEGVEGIGEGAGKAVEDVGKNLQEGIGNIFGGDKKD